VKSMSDPTGEQWLDEHMARGEKMIWLFYVLAGVAAVGVGAVLKWPRTSFPITVGTLVLAGVTLGTGGYIAYAGGHVRHREFRFEAPPPPRMAEHHHEEEQHGAETHEHATEQKPAASAQPQMEHAGHEQTQQPPEGEKAKTEEERKQLEASRLQWKRAECNSKRAANNSKPLAEQLRRRVPARVPRSHHRLKRASRRINMMIIHIDIRRVSLAIAAALLVSCAVTSPPPFPAGN